MNIATSKDDACRFLAEIEAARIIAVDTETTPIIPGKVPDLVSIAVCANFGTFNNSYYFPFGHRPLTEEFVLPFNLGTDTLREVSDTLERFTGPTVFHNIYFDYQVLRQAGVHLNSSCVCTLLMSYMADENGSHRLEDLANKFFGEASTTNQRKIKEMAKAVQQDYSRIPVELLGPYAMEDVELTMKLYLLYVEELKKQELLDLVPREIRYSKILCQIRERGIGVDLGLCQQFALGAQARLEGLQAELGFDPAARNELAVRLFGPAPIGLGLPVLKRSSKQASSRFPDGNPSADKESLERFNHPVVKSVLEWRGLAKAKSTWFDKFPELVGWDSRLHPQLNQARTVTGRLSCQDPNMQQIPRTSAEEFESGLPRAKVKKLFVPRSGYELWEIDYSQIELRLAAAYGKDELMVEAFQNGDDLHQLTADRVGITRYQGKTLNFAVLYGAGSEKVGNLLGVSQEQAQHILATFWRTYPNLANVKFQATLLAQQRGWVRFWTGRKRHFEKDEAHKAFNSIIQGGAGEIIKDAMILIGETYPEVWMINQVHDSLWFELPQGAAEQWLEKLQACMIEPTLGFDVPFTVSAERLN